MRTVSYNTSNSKTTGKKNLFIKDLNHHISIDSRINKDLDDEDLVKLESTRKI